MASTANIGCFKSRHEIFKKTLPTVNCAYTRKVVSSTTYLRHLK